jgi:transcriptional regulator with XRE-family HTH domain
MIDGNARSVIPTDILLDDYYANLHGAYNSMRVCFSASGLSQDDLASSLNVDKSLISRRLNGSENLTLKTLSYMGTAMDCRLAITFVPYAMVGTGNTNTSTPSVVLFVTTPSPEPTPKPANPSKALEQA